MRISFLILLIGFMSILGTPFNSVMGTDLKSVPSVPDSIKAEGTLTSVEEDGSIIIDEGGYLTDSKVSIIDSAGKKISIRQLSLPVRIYFEYNYTENGPVIKLIKEIAVGKKE